MTPAILAVWFAGALGACVGSFLNVCIYRLPLENLSVGEPRRSFCPACRNPILWFDNIPILSWILLRGRCRGCKEKIPFRYPFVEALTALTFALVALHFISMPMTGWMAANALFYMGLLAALIVVTFVDIDHRIIPDEISVTGALAVPVAALFLPAVPVNPTLPGWLTALVPGGPTTGWPWWTAAMGALPLGLVAMALFRRFSPAWDGSVRTWWETRLAFVVGWGLGFLALGSWWVPSFGTLTGVAPLMASLLGMGVGAGSIYGVGVFGKVLFRKDAMGFGDVKLMGLLGGVLGWQEVLLSIFVACIFGSIVGVGMRVITRSSYIPFGPFLAAGAVILMFSPDGVRAGIDGYMKLSRSLDPRILLGFSFALLFGAILLLWFWRRGNPGDPENPENQE